MTSDGQQNVWLMISDLSRDEEAAKFGVSQDWLKRDPLRSDHHVLLWLEDYATAVRKIISRGGTILWDKNGRPRAARPRQTRRADWGFNATVVRKAGERLRWQDREIMHFLEFGCYEYSQDTPPVS